MLVVASHAPNVPGLHAPAACAVAVRPRQYQPAVPVASVCVAVLELNHIVLGRTQMPGGSRRSDDRAVPVPDAYVEVYRAAHRALAPLRPSGHDAIFWTRHGTRLGLGWLELGTQRVVHHLL